MKSRKELVIENLLVDYENRYKEMISFEERYHTQSNIIFFYLSAIIAIATLITSNNNLIPIYQSTFPKTVLFLIIMFVILIMFFLASTMMNYLYMIYIHTFGMSIIGKELNKLIGIDIYIWDSDIYPKILDPKHLGIKTWVKPNVLIGYWVIGLALIISAVFGYVCSLLANSYLFWIYVIFAVLGNVFHFYQWEKLFSTGRNYLRMEISFPPKTIKEINKILYKHKRKNR